MSFPASPTNGQQTAIGGVLYEYNSSTNVWKRIPVVYSLNSNTTTFSNITVTSNVTAGSFLYTNGVSVTSNVQATVNNMIHPFLLAGM
jgi:hypothetical protein